MPIYAYKCGECGHDHDALQKISDAPLTDCPACGKPALTKQVTAAGFQLKGSGWYVTDFRDGGKGAKAGQSEGAGASGADSSSKDTSAAAAPSQASAPAAT